MALVLIKGRELCILDAAPDAWTGEVFVPLNQANTSRFFLHLSPCRNYYKLLAQASCRRRRGIRDACGSSRLKVMMLQKNVCAFREMKNINYVWQAALTKKKKESASISPWHLSMPGVAFSEARLKAQAYTMCV